MSNKFQLGQRVFIIKSDSSFIEGEGQTPENQVGKWGDIIFAGDESLGLSYQVLTDDQKSAWWYMAEWLISEEQFSREFDKNNSGASTLTVGDTFIAKYSSDLQFMGIVGRIDANGLWAGHGFFPYSKYKFDKVNAGYSVIDTTQSSELKIS